MENLINLGASPEEWVFFVSCLHAVSSLETLQLFIKDETCPIQRAAGELVARAGKDLKETMPFRLQITFQGFIGS